jgi:riboflavin synthase
MFTGIVEELGQVIGVDTGPDSARLTVRGPAVTADASLGASIAVDGVCLTVAALAGETFVADVMAETLRRTTLGGLRPGQAVNLERPVTPDSRLGGHLVQGHVDGVGEVRDRESGDRWETVVIGCPAAVQTYLAEKGSVAVDGVSLTIVGVDDRAGTFTVSLIPETLTRTTLGARQVGDRVNLEVDVIAKYVERLLGERVRAR